MADELSKVNAQVALLVASEIEKGIKRAIADISGESVARKLEALANENVYLAEQCGILQDALRDIAQETGTPYAKTATAALARVTYLTERKR